MTNASVVATLMVLSGFVSKVIGGEASGILTAWMLSVMVFSGFSQHSIPVA